jgi:hypothetical protein
MKPNTRSRLEALKLEALKRPRKLAKDPIPEKAIRLTEVYQRVFDALLANPAIINPLLEEYEMDWKKDLEKIEKPWKLRAAANAFFRCHLIWGEMIYGENLYALVRDPDAGLMLQLDPQGWGRLAPPLPSLGQSSDYELIRQRSDYEPILFGIDSDHVMDPYDPYYEYEPGPEGTYIGGAYRPVFFWRDEFERWFQKTFGTYSSKRPGRKPGSGSLEHSDRPFLREMCRLIENGSARSPEDAAGQVAQRAQGASFQSTRTRLAKRYRKLHPPERN